MPGIAMRSLLLATLIAAFTSANSAVAVPAAYYNPATGGIYIKNDFSSKLAAIAVYAPTFSNVAKTDTSSYASIPGAIFDFGDLPYGFTYLNFPFTGDAPLGLFIGDVIVPGVPSSSLIYVWAVGELFREQAVVEIPEPTPLTLCGILAVGYAAQQRRKPK
jgi:hypothetical protein